MPGPMAGPGNRDLQVIASSREQHSQDEQQPLLERAAALLSDRAWTIESSPPYVDSVALDGSLADLASEGFLTTGGNVDLTALEEEMYGPYQCHEEGWVESRRLQR
eukprot:TRINITY_DN33706_c0_g1_i1.p1 TRINITY_DN33706_c0_g1~~TRINITY_DN33706_c0_g1_i1.p1  ORF type:complete len:106 (-),score=24.11 TRINITY_DN33706_c0_g1_i1:100-417(-)